jgi:hypothetical protein
MLNATQAASERIALVQASLVRFKSHARGES